MFEGSFTPGRFIIQRLVYVCHQNLIKIRLLKLQMQTLFINEAHNVWGIQRLVCLYVCHRNFITWGCKNQNTKLQIQTLLINEARNAWGILHTKIYNSAACLYLYVLYLLYIWHRNLIITCWGYKNQITKLQTHRLLINEVHNGPLSGSLLARLVSLGSRP